MASQDPVDEVLRIPELLQNILLQVNMSSLLACRRVSETWSRIIEGSIHLQRKLFLAPATLDQMRELGFSDQGCAFLITCDGLACHVLNPLAIDYETGGLNPYHNAGPPASSPAIKEYTCTTVNLTTQIIFPRFTNSATEAMIANADALPTVLPPARVATKPLKQMFLTQPPLDTRSDLIHKGGFELELNVHWVEEYWPFSAVALSPESWLRWCREDSQIGDGLRLGTMVRTLTEFLVEREDYHVYDGPLADVEVPISRLRDVEFEKQHERTKPARGEDSDWGTRAWVGRWPMRSTSSPCENQGSIKPDRTWEAAFSGTAVACSTGNEERAWRGSRRTRRRASDCQRRGSPRAKRARQRSSYKARCRRC